MNHETLQALFALDVAEVGEKEAAKRWEFWRGDAWVECFQTIKWNSVVLYRRKPDLPWPKVMQDTVQEWPADAPEWANYMANDKNGRLIAFECKPTVQENGEYWGTNEGKRTPLIACPNWRESLIERPKPAVNKIDWSKLRDFDLRWVEVMLKERQKTRWIAWNCDEHTRGNPLPDGLVVEWYGSGHTIITSPPEYEPNWKIVTRFRIIGIQEGWE